MIHSLVPLRFGFHPTDQELVGCFLYKLLVEREPLMPQYHNVIHACSLFGNKLEPSEIWKEYGGPQLVDQDLYFFSELKRLTPKRMDRRVGHGGTWSETESSKLVEVNGNPNPIGRKRRFCYENQGSEDHTGWLLDEYSLFVGPKNDYTNPSYNFDFVICRMRKNDRAGIDLRFFEDNTTFEIEELLGETQVKEACNPSKCENVGNQSLANDCSYRNWSESLIDELMADI